jgi:hypothetical protein
MIEKSSIQKHMVQTRRRMDYIIAITFFGCEYFKHYDYYESGILLESSEQFQLHQMHCIDLDYVV